MYQAHRLILHLILMVRVQYASDIHLEFRPSKFRRILKPSAEILILAGDIGHPFRRTYYQFLRWCSMKFKHVVLIPGNHEYYGSSLKKARRKLKQLSKATGVTVLDRDVLELPEYNLVILGTTLWSYIPPENSFEVLMGINDYQCIEDFDLTTGNTLYLENRNWLRQTIKFYREMNPEYQIVVATHHAPVPEITSAPIYRGKPTNCAFASDCTDVMEGVDVWIFGHTHYNTTFPHTLPNGESVTVTSNQRGYAREDTGYRKDQYLTLDGGSLRSSGESISLEDESEQ